MAKQRLSRSRDPGQGSAGFATVSEYDSCSKTNGEPKSVVPRRFWRLLRHKGFHESIKADAGAMEELGRGEVWCEPQSGGSTQGPPCARPFGPEPLRAAGQTMVGHPAAVCQNGLGRPQLCSVLPFSVVF